MIYVVSGGTKLFAAIGVTYPAGSTLTCTNGTSTLKAKTTTGQWVFAIPKPGTWTVTSTDGTKTKSQSVEISAEGQFESVSLTYELILFDGGAAVEWSGYARVSGNDSYSISSTLTCTRKSGVSLNYTGAVVYTSNPIPLAGYSKLKVHFQSVSGLSSYIGVCSATASNKDDTSGWAASKACSATEFGSGGTAELDISSVNGQSLSIVLGEGYVKNEAGSSCTVDKVWLE